MSRRTIYFGVAIILISLAAIVIVNIQASAGGQIEVVKAFDSTKAELPEGIAIDKVGNIYVSLGPPSFVGSNYGAVRKISPNGMEVTVLAEFPEGPAPAGLAIDAPGNVYFAYPSEDDGTRGVYRLTGDGGMERLPGTAQIFLPNGLALDKQGNLYTSDSIMGAIWRSPRGGSAEAEVWLQHDLIAGCPPDELVGANGVAYWQGNLYVANTAKGLLVRIPILTDGAAGEPEVVAGDPNCDPTDELAGMDGIALDVHGNVFALLVLQNKLVRIDPADGSFETLLSADDGLWNPASLAFGTGKGERESIFISNYAVLPPEPPNSLGPAVLKLDVGVPGLPLP